MQLGVVFPQAEFGTDPQALRDYAQHAEGLGYGHILVTDHIIGADPEDRPGGFRGPFTYKTPFREPFTIFSHLAAVTQKLGFVSGVMILPQRSAALVAKQAAEVDILSGGGRLRLGVANGWSVFEFEGLGVNFHNRGKRIEEQIDLMRKLWTQDLVSYDGKWHKMERLGLNPAPITRPIPVWIGGQSDAAIARAARMSEGWIPLFVSHAEHETYQGYPSERAHEAIALLWAEVEKNGRSRDEVGLEVRIPYRNGNPDDWRKSAEQWQALGASHLDVQTIGNGFTSPKDHMRAVSEVMAAIT